ncbi:protease-4 [Cnuella takakiae]|uniref:Protease-4 n=1 Tax=Cnuella takakiae TaxID=1302690 RepID=A0A1M4VFH9_9BACT|nr:signal peptide peptidase SppA [Cnuella takakiae]OLY92612.1 signal peptide peptidase SppA [Cnuella takakiae]SHE67717.1 protease-4 [Cnuella takakiae]
MAQFFKIFFASLLALFVFTLLSVFLFFGIVAAFSSKEKPEIEKASVLVLDLSQPFNEQERENPLADLTSSQSSAPGLFDVVRLIKTAKTDAKVSGIHIRANGNANSFASSNELRNALLDFKTSGKPVLAYADVMSQGAYFVASTANKVYINPAGGLDWSGYNIDFVFFKNLLDRLQIEPQIFYAGKFKSATEPFRTTQMTPENKVQTVEWLGDLYQHFLRSVSKSRNIDTASLHKLATIAAIQRPEDALTFKLVDGLKYDDEVRQEWKRLLKAKENEQLNLLEMSKYADAADFRVSGKDRIAVVYAQGDIVDGNGTDDNIGGDRFAALVRKVRQDRTIKAIVVRVNSGGGSALASELMWRELELAKKDKPVVMSFGDVAASGGYYMAAGADSIFAHPNTITGSIGVFTLIPNMQGFFNNKLGITFDGVKTAEFADAGGVYKPLNTTEKQIIQSGVDQIYDRFKQRVATGRKRSITYVDSIAQGRVWSGEDALRLGLVDKLGGLQDAIDCAARMAKTNNYRLREYPEQGDWFNRLLNKATNDQPGIQIREQVGQENYEVFKQLVQIRSWTKGVQARIPFYFLAK